MPETENAGPRGRGTGAKMADETNSDATYRGRLIAIVRHRRDCRALDRWIRYISETETRDRYPEPYAAAGMTLGVVERERAA